MNDVDKRAIEKLACAETYHGSERGDAVAAYERGLRAGELHKSPHMNFMSEVCAPIPDLSLRSMYRRQVSVMHGDGQPVNMPFERVPQHEADPGFGPVPPKPKVTELFPKPQIPNEE